MKTGKTGSIIIAYTGNLAAGVTDVSAVVRKHDRRQIVARNLELQTQISAYLWLQLVQ